MVQFLNMTFHHGSPILRIISFIFKKIFETCISKYINLQHICIFILCLKIFEICVNKYKNLQQIYLYLCIYVFVKIDRQANTFTGYYKNRDFQHIFFLLELIRLKSQFYPASTYQQKNFLQGKEKNLQKKKEYSAKQAAMKFGISRDVSDLTGNKDWTEPLSGSILNFQ